MLKETFSSCFSICIIVILFKPDGKGLIIIISCQLGLWQNKPCELTKVTIFKYVDMIFSMIITMKPDH